MQKSGCDALPSESCWSSELAWVSAFGLRDTMALIFGFRVEILERKEETMSWHVFRPV